LVEFVIAKAVEIRDRVGCQFIVLNAKPTSVAFYLRLGFEICPGQPKSRDNPFMYFKLPIETEETG
jgi:hypothetical protein